MRRAGIITTTSDDADLFIDYLYSVDIKAQSERYKNGYAIWIYEEDQLDQARKELTIYQENSYLEKFKAAEKNGDN
ncbi:MAG: hypothetical protein MPJ24_02255, partial [Pirellulaceae bacterium]|nr:hypothetical protein [Pirellulaceae bacterium]